MDTSKEYIKMCEKAEEIQRKWKPQTGDYFTIIGRTIDPREYGNKGWVIDRTFNLLTINEMQICQIGIPDFFDPEKYEIKEITDYDFFIWFPTQSQLQEMILLDWIQTLKRFIWWEKPLYVNSMEQLWLAFVMKEKYNKTWDGAKWTKP